jgi:dihydroorotase
MPLAKVLALLGSRPAQALGLPNCGSLAVGSRADVVVFNPDEKWTFRAADSKSKSKNTPFDGWEFPGRVLVTISEGCVSFRR